MFEKKREGSKNQREIKRELKKLKRNTWSSVKPAAKTKQTGGEDEANRRRRRSKPAAKTKQTGGEVEGNR
ncbi:hypothetical protein BVRB_6g140020 [Beta vulgaris subsp. vulgaris]|nr:hypothetical protein BVRB_6g140020 [Beta vulgaris subsp. vulgaris]